MADACPDMSINGLRLLRAGNGAFHSIPLFSRSCVAGDIALNRKAGKEHNT
jgi:hypothetical protein